MQGTVWSAGFAIETKRQEKFELTVTAQGVVSTDERFTMDDLSLGDNYVPLGVCFQRANGDIIKRAHRKGEKKISNMTLPRLAWSDIRKAACRPVGGGEGELSCLQIQAEQPDDLRHLYQCRGIQKI